MFGSGVEDNLSTLVFNEIENVIEKKRENFIRHQTIRMYLAQHLSDQGFQLTDLNEKSITVSDGGRYARFRLEITTSWVHPYKNECLALPLEITIAFLPGDTRVKIGIKNDSQDFALAELTCFSDAETTTSPALVAFIDDAVTKAFKDLADSI